MSLVDNIDKVQFTSVYPIDNVLSIYSGSITIPVRTDPVNTVTLQTNLGDSCFYAGVFSVNGSSTEFINIGGRKYYDDGAGAYTEYGVEAYSTSSGIVISTRTNDTSAHSCTFKVASIAKPDQGVVDLTTQTAPTIENFLSSDNTYLQIAQDYHEPYSITTSYSNTLTIPHNLGYVPVVRAFAEVDSKLWDLSQSGAVLYQSGFTYLTAEIILDTTNVYIYFKNGTSTAKTADVYCRIYYEQH